MHKIRPNKTYAILNVQLIIDCEIENDEIYNEAKIADCINEWFNDCIMNNRHPLADYALEPGLSNIIYKTASMQPEEGDLLEID